MLRKRIIPVLLIKDGDLVKGSKFKNHRYIGDPLNAVKIFNEKESDELIFLDISKSEKKKDPDFSLISDIAGEALMPLGYGGGVNNLNHIEKIFSIGIEKVIINSASYLNENFIIESAKIAGSQSIVISIDYKKTIFGKYEVFINNGKINTKIPLINFAKKMQDSGAGEIILNSIEREGTGKGYDFEIIDEISKKLEIPVVGLGGAGSIEDLIYLLHNSNVSAAAAGDLFVFHGKHKAVLISYPDKINLQKIYNQ